MRSLCSRLLGGLVAALLVVPPLTLGQDLPTAGTKAVPKTFYEDKKRGWHWYEKTPEPKKKPEQKDPSAPVAAGSENPTGRDFTYEELWNMDPPQFQKVYTNTLNLAVRTLEVSDTEEFYRVQDIARRKSAGFANVAAYVVQTNPQYNVLKDYPVATPGRRARLVSQQDEVSSVIQRARGNHALLYFYSTTCRYCIEQAEILEMFARKYNWEIKGIDVNRQPDLADRFRIETTPTLMMIRQDNPNPFPVAVGVMALDELEYNLVAGVRMLSGNQDAAVNYSVYDFQQGSSFDPEAELRRNRSRRQGDKP